MPTSLIFSPHADDAAAFCGGTIARFGAEGWRTILVRVTDDCRDSVGLSIEETRKTNAAELRDAAAILGIHEIIELGYETDRLADVPETELREKFVYLIRKHQPYAVFSFDPDGLQENNQDHVRVAEAVDEALWVSAFDKHYPEHFKEGLKPWSVVERWFFARKLSQPNYGMDVSEFMEKRIRAMCAHQHMLKHMLKQYQMQLEAWGRRVPWVDEAYEGDHTELVATFLQEGANAVAKEFNMGEGRMGEAFRLERFGDLEGLFQGMSVPIPNAEPAPVREGLDQPAAQETWPEEQLEQIFPSDIDRRIRLMGHHHLCAGAFEELVESTPFQLSYANLVERVHPSPDLEIESIYGYDIFCYQCGYWSEQEGRCSTGWKNKISKDAAVLKHLGIRPGEVHTLSELQRILAVKVGYADLEHFCGPGEWKCEFYVTGACQRAYAKKRRELGIS